jgi:hypothetical protein
LLVVAEDPHPNDSQCNDGVACTVDTCQGNTCSNVVKGSSMASEDFEQEIKDWTIKSSNKNVTWQRVRNKVASGKQRRWQAPGSAPGPDVAAPPRRLT